LTKYTRLVKNFSRILICPLDWGIGHATRCVPVIRQLLQQKHEVIIAADGRPLDFLREYFPELEFIRLPGFRVSYPAGKNMALKMALQAPAILCGIYREHGRLKKIIRDYRIDAVISDNRFGMWSGQAYSVYLTHQLQIKAPGKMKWAEHWLYKAHQWFISHYDECWIPDIPGKKNLSGDLSHQFPLTKNSYFTGILSRFENMDDPSDPDDDKKDPELLVMLSGPEPQRTIFENIILNELAMSPLQNAVILQGIPGPLVQSSPFPGVAVFNHLPDHEFSRLIRHAAMIICRPGYSTIMDLAMLGRNAILVPTPGQTEQEYLAKYLSSGSLFIRMEQKGFSLSAAIKAGKELTELIEFMNDPSLLENVVKGLHHKLSKQISSRVTM
jgi:UDP-N-acetylglucosamine:LPS N-acetylglucosamine transferase